MTARTLRRMGRKVERLQRRATGLQVAGLALLALAVAGGIWLYPELRRYIRIKRM